MDKKLRFLPLLLVLGLLLAIPLFAQENESVGDSTEEPPTTLDPSKVAEELPRDAGTENSCIECHSTIEGNIANIVELFMGSVHREMDLTCEVCHGGDPTSNTVEGAMSAEAGFIGKPDRAIIPEVCSRCHDNPGIMKKYGNLRTDQLELYKTSSHGIGLYERGDINVAVCTDCHTAHNILRVKNPNASVHKTNIPDTCNQCHGEKELMDQYDLDHNIPTDYMEGVHGQMVLELGDLAAPACNNCHGNHGAAPPGVENIENVCGQCHLQTEKYYNQSRHSEVFEAMGMGRCIVCHNQHKLQKPTDRYFDEEADANCGMCHYEDTEQYDKIIAMSSTIDDIRGMHERAAELVEETELTTHLSMHEMIPQVEQVHTKLLTARILQHGTDLDAMVANRDAAEEQFVTIESFTEKLIERAKFNKLNVALLAGALTLYGLLVWGYRKFVLDHTHPWQEYEGPPLGPGEEFDN